MSESRMSTIIEMQLQAASSAVRKEFELWLRQHGIHDYIEASCDTLDIEESEIDAYLAAYESGALNLPLLLYSYDRHWVDRFTLAVAKQFGRDLVVSERLIADELWQEAWQPGFRFLETEKFVVGSADFFNEIASKKLIRLESGKVFGSGQHASTQAMLALLEEATRSVAGDSFLDVGTGTGVLCFVAHHLGYQDIVGTDIEADALQVARLNQQTNNIFFELVEGSLPERRRTFATIVCNILPPTLTCLLPELLVRLKPKGRLYLAGLNEVTEKTVVDALPESMVLAGRRQTVRGWVAREFVRKDS